jgi:hypothetical protein
MTQTHGGKGSRQRKRQVSQQQWDENYKAFQESTKKAREQAEAQEGLRKTK